MKKRIYYITQSGTMLTQRQMHVTYEGATGKKVLDNEGEYIRWLDEQLTSGRYWFWGPLTEVQLLQYHKKLDAVMQYRNYAGCTLGQAKEVIELLLAGMKAKNIPFV